MFTEHDLHLLRTDEDRVRSIRAEIPAITAVTYMNTGTSGPVPNKVYSVMRDFLDREHSNGRIGMQAYQVISEYRESAKAALGRLLNAAPQAISLTPSTSAGMAMALNDIDWVPGDEIVTIDIEYPAILRLVSSLENRRGIVGRVARVGNQSGDIASAIDEQIGPKTKAVTLSHVSYTNGAVFDIAAIGSLCRDRGITTVIDGAQSVGALAVDLPSLNVDYYAFAGQKWLCGPSASGGLYAHESRRLESTPYQREESPYPNIDSNYYFETNRRFEVFYKTDPGSMGGLAAAASWLLDDVGAEWAFDRAHRLARYVSHRLTEIPNITYNPPDAFATMSAFGIDGRDPHDVVLALMEQDIQTRSIPNTPNIRLSTHYYNTIEDVDRAIEAITVLARGQ